MADKSADKSTSTEAASSSTRRQPSRIRDIGHLKDVEAVKARIKDVYGFSITDQYARDFVAFVEQMTKGG